MMIEKGIRERSEREFLILGILLAQKLKFLVNSIDNEKSGRFHLFLKNKWERREMAEKWEISL